MKKRVYIETTIVSYLTAKPSRDIILAGQQEVTREWWKERRSQFSLCVSQLVLEEAGKGDADAAARRIHALADLPVLTVTQEAQDLAGTLLRRSSLPRVARLDALHLSIATVYQVDVLLTWNCTHLANAVILGGIGRLVRSLGYEMPIVCTPNELMGEERKSHD
ncbi:MAG: type II toxin-antitoxin system VapC family toxin [Phycisphaerae bacterium]|nr:type II toxin-antitoxin system VapC family toxin [Phycisphaerae bacterium]